MRFCAGHLPCTTSNVILSTALGRRRLQTPGPSAQTGEGTCPNYTAIRARNQPEVSPGQTACSLFHRRRCQRLRALGRPRVRPSGSGSQASPRGRGAVATARTRPERPRGGPGFGEASQGLPGALGGTAANIDFGKHHFARSAGRGRGRADPGGGGSGSAFRRGH